MRTTRIGSFSVLMPPPRPPATPVSACLVQLQQDWQRQNGLAALWQAWPRIAGPQLAPHCRPLQLAGNVLTVGAAPGPWLQALRYNRHQLLGSLRASGFQLRDLRFAQHHPAAAPAQASLDEADVWASHPSRIDVHGLAARSCCCPCWSAARPCHPTRRFLSRCWW